MELPPWQGTPPPPSPAPGPPKSFLQRIGQPLAGMAPQSPPARPSPTQTGGRSLSPGRIRHMGQSLASLLVGSMAPTPAPSCPPPPRRPLSRSPSPPRRTSRRDGGTPRSPSPTARCPLPASTPSTRRSPSPHGCAPGSPSSLRRSTRAPERAPESEAVAGEDGAGRYAVVTPQIQRLGSFRRASRMYKQHWSKQHVVRVREMPDAWTAEQGYPRHPAERGWQRGSQRGADIARYLSQRSAAGGWRDRNPWADGYLGTKQPWRTKVTPAVGCRGERGVVWSGDAHGMELVGTWASYPTPATSHPLTCREGKARCEGFGEHGAVRALGGAGEGVGGAAGWGTVAARPPLRRGHLIPAGCSPRMEMLRPDPRAGEGEVSLVGDPGGCLLS